MEPENVHSEQFAAIKDALRGYVDRQELPCLISLIHVDGEIVFCDKYGYADMESDREICYDDIFRIASMTKPVTAVAALMLYEEGKFALDDPISRFIPSAANLKVCEIGEDGECELIAAKKEITMLDLFTHTSGIANGFNPEHPVDRLYQETFGTSGEHYSMSLKKFCEKLMELPLKHHPGTQWGYSDSIHILGYVIEILSGEPFDQFLKKRVFEPLEMQDTDFFVPADKLSRVVPIHVKNEDGELVAASPEMQKLQRDETKLKSGGGGLSSSISDYLNFCVMLVNGGSFRSKQLLKPDTVALLAQDHTSPRQIDGRFSEEFLSTLDAVSRKNNLEELEGHQHGLSVAVKIKDGNIPKGIIGWGGGATTTFWIDPARSILGISLSQFMPNWATRAFHEFKELTYGALKG